MLMLHAQTLLHDSMLTLKSFQMQCHGILLTTQVLADISKYSGILTLLCEFILHLPSLCRPSDSVQHQMLLPLLQ